MKKTSKTLLALGVLAASGAGLWSLAQSNDVPALADGETTQNEAGGHEHGEGAAHGSTVHTHTTRLRFSSQPAQLTAGKPAKWTLQIVDNVDATPINNFETVHDKKLHLIVVSNDLSYFSHVHPQFTRDGKFELSKALPRAGTYRLYADYKPQGEEGEVALQQIKVGGANPLPTSTQLVADTMRSGWMTKTVAAHDEGFAPKPNARRYIVALMPMPSRIVAGRDVMLHFQVRDTSGKPLAKLEPYLGAQGHCVILSSDPQIYLHTHPMSGGHEGHDMGGMSGMNMNGMDHGSSTQTSEQAGADVMFHTNFPKAGLYKVWGQFKHNGKIITAPFVVNVGAPQVATDTQPNTSSSTRAAVPSNAQKITVALPAGYKDGAARVQAGKPVALTFKLTSNAGCGNTVVVPAANWRKTLEVGQSATVVYTPTKSGTLAFACGMGMMKGSVVVQ
jgi:hypothetical protein